MQPTLPLPRMDGGHDTDRELRQTVQQRLQQHFKLSIRRGSAQNCRPLRHVLKLAELAEMRFADNVKKAWKLPEFVKPSHRLGVHSKTRPDGRGQEGNIGRRHRVH